MGTKDILIKMSYIPKSFLWTALRIESYHYYIFYNFLNKSRLSTSACESCMNFMLYFFQVRAFRYIHSWLGITACPYITDCLKWIKKHQLPFPEALIAYRIIDLIYSQHESEQEDFTKLIVTTINCCGHVERCVNILSVYYLF